MSVPHGGLILAASAAAGTSAAFVPIAVALITTAGLIAAAVLGPMFADKRRQRHPDNTDVLLDALEKNARLEKENARLKAKLAHDE